MDNDKFNLLEVKPKQGNRGWYFVTLFQFEKDEDEHPDYIKDWLSFDGKSWKYEGYEGFCYVCFIHKKDQD